MADEAPAPKPPLLPHWAHARMPAESEMPVEVEEIYDDVDIALFRASLGGSHAFKLASMFESGELPYGVDIEEAMSWYHFAAKTGDRESALRLALLLRHRNVPRKEKAICELLEQALGAESRFVAIPAAIKLLEIGNLSEKALEAIESLLSKLDGHPDFHAIRDGLVQARKQGLPGELSVVVATTKIEEDKDFKAGIHKRLEYPVRLQPLPDPDGIQGTLDTEFPWFAEINAAIHRELAAATFSTTPAFKLRPILLAGPPGVGKTSWCQRLAELVGVPFRVVAAAGSSDSMSLRGTSRGWSTARPGLVAETIASERLANPIFFVDEIEKSSPDNRNGRIWDVLLQMLEPSSARCYLDECLQVPLNLSWVSWIATANEIGKLPKPLLERFEVMVVPRPGPEYTETIIHGSMNAFARQLGVDPRMLPPLTVDDLEILDRAGSPREINRLVRTMTEEKLVMVRKGMRN